ACGQVLPQHARVVEAEVGFPTVLEPYQQEAAEMLANVREEGRAGQEHAPALAPALLEQRLEQSGRRRQLNQVGGEVSQFFPLGAFVERLVPLARALEERQDAGIAGGIE